MAGSAKAALEAMSRVLAIAQLTWKAAFRFRLFWVLCVLLIGSVVLLPILIKHDGTARGFTQILLTYTLSVITVLLGFATLWLSCGILAREVEDCQMQVVATKPVARWQIWLGKWLGVTLLNLALLALAGGSVYALLLWRANQLPAEQQRVLRNEIFVARASLKQPAPDIDEYVEKFFQERLAQNPVPPEQHGELRSSILAQVQAGLQVVPAGYQRSWNIDFGLRKNFIQDRPLYIRAKFYSAQTKVTGTYFGTWYVGERNNPNLFIKPVSIASDTFYEFEVPAELLTANGQLPIVFHNQNDIALLFPLEDGLEVLYREGGFGLNFARGLLIVLFWLALLAALGLASASFLSFPVAAFFSLTILVIALSSGTLASIVSEGTLMGTNHETGVPVATFFDRTLLPVFKGILVVLGMVQGFSPVEALSTGRSIGWETLGRAFAQVVVLLGGFVAICGMFIFNRRELATAQGTQ